MIPKLKISQCVLTRLSAIKEKCFGCLYGIIYGNNLIILGFISENDEDNLNIQDSFPAEVDLCGIIGIGEDEYNCSRAKKLLQDVDVTDNPLFLNYKIGQNSEIDANFIVHGKLESASYEYCSESEIWSQFLIVRLQTKIPFTCGFEKSLVQEASQVLRKKLASGQVAFHFPKTKVYLMGSDVENGLTGLSGEPNTGELCDFSSSLEEGCSTHKIKKKTCLADMDILQVTMLRRTTIDTVDGSKNHAPIIDINKRIYECISMSLKIDAMAMVHRDTKVINLYEILIESLCRNLRLLENCFINQMSGDKYGDGTVVSFPEPFHFLPANCGHFITRFYPKDIPESHLVSERKALHERFFVPKNWPCFKRTNAFITNDELPVNGPLINPHENLPALTNTNTEVGVVRGKYSYYHYMQQNFDDNGWGCAYRSFQTIFSWFRWQGYTEDPIPTHKEIQKLLVNIGDKTSSFIGSRQWIGSTEISFCLESMLGVTSRIIHTNSGEEIGNYGLELIEHFRTQGTPIMIGGGQLAHTIIGIEYEKSTGNTRFLILDPHYTGGEDIHIINGKGWCGWKNLSFWNKSTYYNLCLPQIPKLF